MATKKIPAKAASKKSTAPAKKAAKKSTAKRAKYVYSMGQMARPMATAP
jgi:hypothetical protein